MVGGRILPLLAVANFAAASAGMVIAGLLQLIAGDLLWRAAQAGRLIFYYALGFAVGAPLLGAAVGTWCRKRVVVMALVLVAIGSIGSALAGGATTLPGATSNRSGVSGLRLVTTRFPRSLIMEGENYAQSHHGRTIHKDTDETKVARRCDRAITF